MSRITLRMIKHNLERKIIRKSSRESYLTKKEASTLARRLIRIHGVNIPNETIDEAIVACLLKK